MTLLLKDAAQVPFPFSSSSSSSSPISHTLPHQHRVCRAPRSRAYSSTPHTYFHTFEFPPQNLFRPHPKLQPIDPPSPQID